VSRGIQDCGVDPVEYKAGRDLKVGDKVSVWWMPTGARLQEILPYTGKLARLFPDGAFIGRFDKTPSAGAPKHYADMVVSSTEMLPMMP
jgi:hypothetical protein